MANKKSQERSPKEQETESTLKCRAARQKRVQGILQILGFYRADIGIAVTVKLFMSGDVKNAMIIGFLTAFRGQRRHRRVLVSIPLHQTKRCPQKLRI